MREKDKELEKIMSELEEKASDRRKNILVNIRLLERIKGIGRGDLEDFIDSNRGDISRMMNSKRDFTLTQMVKLSEKLQVSIDELSSEKIFEVKSEEFITDFLDKVETNIKKGNISWTQGDEWGLLMNEDIGETCIDDFYNRCRASKSDNSRRIVRYYRGKCQDNREFLLIKSVNRISEKDGVWDLSILKWRCDIDYMNNEYYSLGEIINIYSLLGKKREVLYHKNLKLVNSIESSLKDIHVSPEAMREIDLICGE